MSERKPFNLRTRKSVVQNRVGYRPRNDWGGGDLPAPWAEGDVVAFDGRANDRLRGQTGPYFVVTYAPSIDEGDAWYFRVWDGSRIGGSDRLHVAYDGRVSPDWQRQLDENGPCDYMAGFTLVETADPEGLALRERMLAEGWALPVLPRCEHCGQELPEAD